MFSIHTKLQLNAFKQFRMNKVYQNLLNHLEAQNLAYPQLETFIEIDEASESLKTFFSRFPCVFNRFGQSRKLFCHFRPLDSHLSEIICFETFFFHLHSF